FISGVIVASDGSTAIVETALGVFEGTVTDPSWQLLPGETVTLSIRPESWMITTEARGRNVAHGRLGEAIYLGEVAQYQLHVNSLSLKIFEMNPQLANRPAGRELSAYAMPHDVVILRA
ncbi:MAG TPA: TOBE domain-containing protein, partial [Terrimicrobiaceae bacterium]